MLNILFQVELRMPEFLTRVEDWNTVLVDYHPPIVKRLWRQWGDYRIYLHEILPCSAVDVLFHPHPWPSAVRILSGTYLMDSGYSETEEPPTSCVRQILTAGSAYSMPDSDQWHAVQPLGAPSVSLMVSGLPNGRSGIGAKSSKALEPLTKEDAQRIFDFCREYYA